MVFFEGNIRFESEYIETNNHAFFYTDISNLKNFPLATIMENQQEIM
jgi:hypothetical protein